MYPKERLAPQNTLGFLTLGENQLELYCLPRFDVGLWAVTDVLYHLLSKPGVVSAGVNSSPCFGSHWI